MSKSFPKTTGSNAPGNLPNDLPSALLLQDTESEKKPAAVLGQPIPGALDFHELANLLPMSGIEAFAKLRTDIEKYGLLEPITVWEGKILDGRNRAKACKELGIEPKYETYTGNDPIGFVLSKNVHRRHLTPSQTAMLVEKLANLPKGRPDLNAHAFSQDEVAERLGVSRRLVQFAQKVHTKAIPEVAALVEAGKLSVDKAAALADAAPEEQRDAVAAIESGEKCPAFKPQNPQGKNSKEPSLEEQLFGKLRAALEHPKDSPERSDALIELFKTLSDEAFAKRNPREEFLQGIMAECVEYGVQLPTATA
jgi:ParB-like chromosome segregation protein Spo0J